MGILSKDLTDVVTKVLDKRNRISERISSLENDISSLQSNIKNQFRQLMESELSDDLEGQEKCKKEIKKWRLKLIETEDLLNSYKDEKESSLSPQEEQKIKEAAGRETAEYSKKYNALSQEKKGISQQILSLKQKEDHLSKEMDSLQYSYERKQKNQLNMIKHLIPNFNNIEAGYWNEEGFIKSWLAGESVNRHLKKLAVKEPEHEYIGYTTGDVERKN